METREPVIDNEPLTELNEFNCTMEEEPSSVLALPGTGSGNTPAFALGTVVIRPEEREPSRGRIVLLSVASAQATHTKTLDIQILKSIMLIMQQATTLSEVRGAHTTKSARQLTA